MWSLVVTLTQVYSEKEQAGKKELQNVQFGEKMNTRKFIIGAKACAEGDERPDS